MVTHRIGIGVGKPISNDFPQKTRTALTYLIDELDEKRYLANNSSVIRELNRIGCFTSSDISIEDKSFKNQVASRLAKLKWYEVMNFIERVYEKLLTSVGYQSDEWHVSEQEVREYYSKEISNLLVEHNLAFAFQDGIFTKVGKAQTQKNIARVGLVLSNPKFAKVKNQFNKAISFFSQLPNPDSENCVKEALCSIEICLEILTGKKASLDFDQVINKLKGNDPGKMPAPIAESIKKIYAYRGSGQGVAHGSIDGNRVLAIDAELILSLVAAFITYLIDLFTVPDEIPF